MVTSFSSTKTLTFSTLGAVFILEQVEFQRFDFILIILAYSGFRTCLQIVVPPTMNSPVVAPPPMPKSAVTAEERAMVIDFTKTQVLPDANSSALIKCEKNNATRVLAAAIYSVLEKKFFDTVLPRADVATAFHCNTSQLSKALTGIEYASGPHQYTPKKSATKKRPAEEGEQSTTAKTQKKTQIASRDDTLSTPSTSDSDTPLPDVFL